MSRPRDAAARFWPKVARRADDECWEWLASVAANGYGNFEGNGAHRFSYELTKGKIPEGLYIDHLCRNRSCVNPAHLEAVPPAVNTMRGDGPSVWRRLRAERCTTGRCAGGHPWTEESTYYRPSDGFRECRICRRERSAKRDWAAERAARKAS